MEGNGRGGIFGGRTCFMAVKSELAKWLAHHKKIALDTNLFIYRLLDSSLFREEVNRIFEAIRERKVQAITSVITVLESSVHFFQKREEAKLPFHLEFLSGGGRIQILGVDERIALKAASLRGYYRLRVADALQIATAIQGGATLFLTADRDIKLKEVEGVFLGKL